MAVDAAVLLVQVAAEFVLVLFWLFGRLACHRMAEDVHRAVVVFANSLVASCHTRRVGETAA